MQLDLDGEHFSVIMSHLRHKTLEPKATFDWNLVKPERRGQFEAMLDFLGLRKSFSCGCSKLGSPNRRSCYYCGQAHTETWTAATNGQQMCSNCHLRNCPNRAR